MPAQYFANKISNNGTTKVSASTDYKILVTAVTNAHTAATTLTFEDDGDLAVLEAPTGSIILNPPIMCSSFTPSHAAMSIVYYEAKSPYSAQ